MNYLVHLSFPIYSFHSLIILNEAQRLIDDGNEVTLLYCNNGVQYCFANTSGDAKICFLCKKMQRQWVGLLRGNFKAISYKDLITQDIKEKVEKLDFDYNSVNEIKAIKYKNVKVGFGALSTYISKTRNLNPEFNLEFKSFFNNLLNTQCEVIEMLDVYTQKHQIDCIVVLNGRHFEVRPFFDYAIENNITLRCLEKGNSLEKDDFRGFDYSGFLPHNLIKINSLINEIWEESELPNDEKINLGKSFFEKRKNSIEAGYKVFTLNQEKDLLPQGWDTSFRNFVILNSSEDEFAAVGDEFDKLSFFSDQITGIKKIAEMLLEKKDIRLYLRVHPNLMDVKYSYHFDLYELDKMYPNLTIIRADDKISTYALIENAEKVIVFGSSTGIESVYWGKPVILLAGALYYYMNLCYIPKSNIELLELLEDYLQPFNNEDAIKYGFYILSNKGIAFDKLTLDRAKAIPFSPLKINKESYVGLIKRFLYANILFHLEAKSNKLVPTLEKSTVYA
jgi:hypothetical protein